MKKIFWMLGLLASVMFLMGCSSELTSSSDVALAGQAVKEKIYVSCSDPDGLNPYKATEVKYTYNYAGSGKADLSATVKDKCQRSNVFEYYCNVNVLSNKIIPCKLGCSNGACITCVDSDGGENYEVKGTAKAINKVSEVYSESTDYCDEKGNLDEYYCSSDGVIQGISSIKCPSGKVCQDGACVAQSCTPGLTGKVKCIQESGYYWAVQEYQKGDCSTYLGTTWADKKFCGDVAISCSETKGGCCGMEPLPGKCILDVYTNGTKSQCTGETVTFTHNCSTDKSNFPGEFKTCKTIYVNNYNYTGCFDSCAAGEKKVACENGYAEYTCSNWGFYYPSSSLSACPQGTTCNGKVCQ